MKNRPVKLVAVIAMAASAWPLAAQNVPAPSSTTGGAESEEVVKLSPFEVSVAKDAGYVATETLAGTRIRTDLKDVGSAISVITKSFLDDIGATDSSTLLQYTPNAEVAGTRGTYGGMGNGTGVDETANLRAPQGAQRIRGLAAADNTRDFYVTDIPWDSFNVDRIDIQRGPNSILFGLGSPAGIVNASTRNAEYVNRGEVQARVGSYGTLRTSLDVNRTLIDNVLAVRFDALWNGERYMQDAAFQNDRRYYGAIRFEPQLFRNREFHTTIRAKYEKGNVDANRPRTVPPNDSISPWFRSRTVSADNPFGGMGRQLEQNPYDVWRTDNAPLNSSRGWVSASSSNYMQYLQGNTANQQQPFYLIDGTTNQLYRVEGGWINAGARSTSGGFTGAANGIPGKRTNNQWDTITSLPGAANNYQLNLYQYGQYRNLSLLDSSMFDFYNTLIDGPNKWEQEKWNAYNVDITQTGWNDRVGIEFTYDRQKYRRAGENLLGTPTLNLDINQRFADYYLANSTNPNVGRPIVQGAGGNGGNSYESDRKYLRGSIFAEVRATDFLNNKDGFLAKLIGKHRFNAVYSNEKYLNENRSWQMYANSREWAGYWNGTDGNGSSITDRTPLAFIYLGSSIINRSAPTGANIPGVTAKVVLPDTGIHEFDPTWLNFSIPFGTSSSPMANWNVPSSMWGVWGGLPNPEATNQLTQASNPDNMIGWTYFQNNLLRYNNGADNSLLRLAQKSLRQTTSYAATWQAFLWNDAIVPTIGWRHDEVKGKDVTAPTQPLLRSTLNLQPNVYRLPDTFPANQIFKDNSTSYGGVVHVNRLFGEKDPLPFNVSVSYSKSDNFQITSTRRDLYGTPIGNPTGSTKDYGIWLSTKDRKYSLRAVKYDTSVQAASAGVGDPGGLGRIIQQGLRFRNVFLYNLGVYDWATREQWVGRNTWATTIHPDTGATINGADQTLTLAQGRALEDAAISTWNQIQKDLAAKGFFQAWGFTPTTATALTDRTTYEAAKSSPTALNPASQYLPDPATVYAYTATAPQGFTLTADTKSKGYEYEFTANPLPNWRISFNASQTTAMRNNVGGPVIDEYVAYLNSKLDGTPAGNMPQFGNTGLSISLNVWNPWKSNYALLKLQENTNVSELRKWRYNVVTNYTFREGFLKNVGVGGSYRFVDKVTIGYPLVPLSATAYTFDLSTPWFGPSEDSVDLWTSYERRINDRINWKIQLNVRNALAKKGLIPISLEPDGKTWASVRTKPVQEWFLTNTFSF